MCLLPWAPLLEFRMILPHDASLAASALQILNSALGAVKQTRETAKDIKDSAIKQQINTVYDYIIELKETLLELKEENVELRHRLDDKQSIRRDNQTGYVYKGEDADPFCPRCYEKDDKSIHLDPPHRSVHGQVSRYCRACCQVYYEH